MLLPALLENLLIYPTILYFDARITSFRLEQRHTDDNKKMKLEENKHADFDFTNKNTTKRSENDSKSQHNKDNDSSQNAVQRNTIPEDAAAYIAAQRKGSLEVSLAGPTKDSSKVSASVSIVGEAGTVDEESPGCAHPAFGKLIVTTSNAAWFR